MAANIDVIKSYLVSLGFSINDTEYQKVNSTLQQVARNVEETTKKVTGNFLQAAAEIVGALGSVTAGAAAMVDKIIMADQKYQNMALTMHMTVEATREMDMALKAMGTTLEAVAWNPEQRQQYFALIAQQNQMSVGQGGEQAFKQAREVRFEFVRMKLEAQYALMWISYMLIEKLGGPLGNVQDKLKNINDYITTHLPQISDKIANWIIMIINLFKTVIRYINADIDSLERLWGSLSKGEKAVAAFGALITAFFIIGPLGKARIIITGLLLLLDDFYAYMDGRKSSATLAPIWKFLIDLNTSLGRELSTTIAKLKIDLMDLASQIDSTSNNSMKLFNDMLTLQDKQYNVFMTSLEKSLKKEGVWGNFKDTLSSINSFLDTMVKVLDLVAKKLGILSDDPKYLGFWDLVNKGIAKTVNGLLDFIKTIMQAGQILALLAVGDFKGAWKFIEQSGEHVGKGGSTRSWGAGIPSSYTGDTDTVEEMIKKASTESGLNNVGLLRALIGAESSFNPTAGSSAGAYGYAQLMPGTAQGLGVDINDPYQNMLGGALYLKQQMDKFKSIPDALAAYNAGPGAVEKYGGIPPYQETQDYVSKIMGQYIAQPTSYNPNQQQGYSYGLSQAAQNYQDMTASNAYYSSNGGNNSSGNVITVGNIYVTESPDGTASGKAVVSALQDSITKQDRRINFNQITPFQV